MPDGSLAKLWLYHMHVHGAHIHVDKESDLNFVAVQ